MDRNKFTLPHILSLAAKREPDFNRLLTILKREKADRPVLYELFMNDTLFTEISGPPPGIDNYSEKALWILKSFRKLGYDYFSLVSPPAMGFPKHEHDRGDSLSQNDLTMIRNQEDFDNYPWPQMENVDFSYLDRLDKEMIPGMKMIPLGPGGVLENTTEILGFDNMCYLLFDNPVFLKQVFDRVGEILLSYYELVVQYDCVGALMANDDWGFATQTMLPPRDMIKYVSPWHKRIAQTAHKAGKPSILHSCGNLEGVMENVINEIGHDGKHSFEDKIIPIEKALDKWGDRIALLGGIDMDFLCRAEPQDVYKRAVALLEKTGNKGYALGSGNSIPTYIPEDSYFAILLAGLE
jgi:uroporphyrinogen decarboxylase